MEISRLEVLLILIYYIVPLLFLLGFAAWLSKYWPKPMATYTVPRSMRRPGSLTTDEEYEEATRRG